MKRSKDLIRDILLMAESHDRGFSYHFSENYDDDAGTDFPGIKSGDLSGHFKLLLDNNYLEGDIAGVYHTIFHVSISSITMKGYDLLDSIRDQGVWAEIKKELGIAGESWNLEIIAKLGTKIVAKKLGIT